MIALIASVFTFSDELKGVKVLMFVDNVPAACALSQGISKQEDLQCLSSLFHSLCAGYHVKFWIEWVPSEANIADVPSRQASTMHFARTSVFPPGLFNELSYKNAMAELWGLA